MRTHWKIQTEGSLQSNSIVLHRCDKIMRGKKQTNKKPKDCLRLEKPKEALTTKCNVKSWITPESGKKKKKASIGKLEKIK